MDIAPHRINQTFLYEKCTVRWYSQRHTPGTTLTTGIVNCVIKSSECVQCTCLHPSLQICVFESSLPDVGLVNAILSAQYKFATNLHFFSTYSTCDGLAIARDDTDSSEQEHSIHVNARCASHSGQTAVLKNAFETVCVQPVMSNGFC